MDELHERALGVGALAQERVGVALARVREQEVEADGRCGEGGGEGRHHDQQQPGADAARQADAHSIV